MGSMALILGIWTLLAGARMTRGEEERGAMDIRFPRRNRASACSARR